MIWLMETIKDTMDDGKQTEVMDRMASGKFTLRDMYEQFKVMKLGAQQSHGHDSRHATGDAPGRGGRRARQASQALHVHDGLDGVVVKKMGKTGYGCGNVPSSSSFVVPCVVVIASFTIACHRHPRSPPFG
jgi:signal recognition particle GTPase